MTSLWRWAAIFVCLSVHYVIHHWVSLSGIVNYPEENNIRGLNGTRSCGRPDMAVLYDYTTCWLSPVKCLLTLMNGCNMPRITTRHATHSLMASHNGQDVPAMPQKGSRRERERRWERGILPTLYRQTKDTRCPHFKRQDANIAVTCNRINERILTEIK